MSKLIQYIVTMIAIAAVTRWLRKKPQVHFLARWLAKVKPDRPNTLYYPEIYLVIFVFGLLFWLAIIALVLISRAQGNPTATWRVVAAFVGFTLLPILGIIAYFTDRHYLTEEGIVHARWMGLRGRDFIPWGDIRRVSYSRFWTAFVLHTSRGKAYVSATVVGIPQLADFLRRKVPASAIDKSACAVLLELSGVLDGFDEPVRSKILEAVQAGAISCTEALENLKQKGGYS